MYTNRVTKSGESQVYYRDNSEDNKASAVNKKPSSTETGSVSFIFKLFHLH